VDLQHFGWDGDTTPQRRRRVFVLGTRTGDYDPAEVLLVADGLLGNLAASQEAGEGFASDAGASVDGAGVLTYDARGNGEGAIANTLSGDHQNRVTDYTALVLRNREGKPGGGKGPLLSAERETTLGTSNDQVVFPTISMGAHTAAPGSNGQDAIPIHDAMIRAGVGVPRRLLPVETEALMGWPRNHTAIGVDENGREYHLSDTARYRLVGNGVGSPVTAWIGMRLKVALDNALPLD
jgi:site-specific DNA-cytosine methylase